MKIQIALPFLLVIGALILSKQKQLILLMPSFMANEIRTIDFVPEDINLLQRQSLVVSRGLKSPIEIVKTPSVKEFPPVPLTAVAPQPLVETAKPPEIPKIKVSMIITGERKMAIANGVVIKEGDTIGGMKVLKIENNRVLLKDIQQKGGQIWVYLE